MAVRTGGPAPYAPPATVLAFLERIRRESISAPINGEVLQGIGVSESLAPRTLASLQLLDFITEDGRLTAEMEALARTPPPAFPARLAEHVRTAYAEVFAVVDPERDSVEAIQSAFFAFEPRGRQGRMAELFLRLCEEAGLIKEKAPDPPAARRAVRANGAPGPSAAPAKTSEGAGRPASDEEALSGVPTPIVGLLETLPSGERGWTGAERARFLMAFEAILDYCIPVRLTEEPTGGERGASNDR